MAQTIILENILTESTPAKLPRQSAPLKEKTKILYRQIYGQLLNQSKTKTDRFLNEDEFAVTSLEQVITDWMGDQERYSANTINLQRSALLWALNADRPYDWEAQYARVLADGPKKVRAKRTKPIETPYIDLDANPDPPQRKRVRGRVIPEADFRAILNELLKHRTKRSAQTQNFLIAGVASGARPIEWVKAHWLDEEETILRIYTAKSKAHNPLTGQLGAFPSDNINPTASEEQKIKVRDVPIESEDRPFVRMHLHSVADAIQKAQAKEPSLSDEDAFSKYFYLSSKHSLWRTCLEAFQGREERLYSLADTRQTFSANTKARLGNEGAAKLLGHSMTTSRGHYAPARAAWARYKGLAPKLSNKDENTQNDSTKNQIHAFGQ